MSIQRELTDKEVQYLIPYHYRKGRKIVRTSTLPRIGGARLEHEIPVKNGEHLRLVFESINSDWVQGVQLETDKSLIIDRVPYRHGSIVFYNPRHSVLDVTCMTMAGFLWLWNVWDFRSREVVEPPGSVISHVDYCGMLVEERPDGYKYRCNEGRDDDDYDDLVFRIERTRMVEPPQHQPSKRRSGNRGQMTEK